MNRRPAGVVAAAIVLGLVTLMLLLFALGSGAMAIMAPHLPSQTATGSPPPPPGLLLGVLLFSTLFYLLLAGWGGATLVGLIRMRPWARISIMVIGGGLVLLGLLSAAGIAVTQMSVGPMPLPPGTDRRVLHITFLFMGLWCLTMAAVGVWWLVYFALRRTRYAFRLTSWAANAAQPEAAPIAPNRTPAGPLTDFSVAQPLQAAPLPTAQPQAFETTPEHWPAAQSAQFQPLAGKDTIAGLARKSGRPVSITVIAVLLLIGSFFALIQMASSQPVFLFSVVLTGWPAHVTMLMWCAVSGVAGLGLMKLQKPAWVLAFGLFCATALNGLLIVLPGSRTRFMSYMQTVVARSRMGLPAPPFGERFVFACAAIGAGFAVLYAVAMLVLLWRAKWAFEREPGDQAAV